MLRKILHKSELFSYINITNLTLSQRNVSEYVSSL